MGSTLFAQQLAPESMLTGLLYTECGSSQESDATSEEAEFDYTRSTPTRPALLRRRRGRSDLKRIQSTTGSTKAGEAEVTEVAQIDHRSEIITVYMLQDIAQSS